MTLLNISVTPIGVTSFVFLLTDLLYGSDFWKKKNEFKKALNKFRYSLSYPEVLHFVFTTGISSNCCKPTFLETFRSFLCHFYPHSSQSASGSHRNIVVLVCHWSLYFRWPWTRHQDNSELSANGCEEEAELNKLGDPSPPEAPPLDPASGVIIRVNQGILRFADY